MNITNNENSGKEVSEKWLLSEAIHDTKQWDSNGGFTRGVGKEGRYGKCSLSALYVFRCVALVIPHIYLSQSISIIISTEFLVPSVSLKILE